MNVEALDQLERASSLIELIKMACRENDEELNAIGAGLSAVQKHLEAVETLAKTQNA